ncbi:hypothetical protein Hanom_Chr07g00660491 [Helianthus anomalus]
MVGHPFFNQSKHFFFFLNNKTNPLRGECRHQIEDVRGVKNGVDMARADWSCIRNETPLKGECPVPFTLSTIGTKKMCRIKFSDLVKGRCFKQVLYSLAQLANQKTI